MGSRATLLNGRSWTDLARLDSNERTAAMVREYEELAELDTEARRAHLAEHVRAAYDLDEDDLCAMTESRIRAWLGMDRDAAITVAKDFESVLATTDAATAIRRVVVVQSIASRLSEDEKERLRDLVPSARVREEKTASETEHPSSDGRSRWRFWSR